MTTRTTKAQSEPTAQPKATPTLTAPLTKAAWDEFRRMTWWPKATAVRIAAGVDPAPLRPKMWNEIVDQYRSAEDRATAKREYDAASVEETRRLDLAEIHLDELAEAGTLTVTRLAASDADLATVREALRGKPEATEAFKRIASKVPVAGTWKVRPDDFFACMNVSHDQFPNFPHWAVSEERDSSTPALDADRLDPTKRLRRHRYSLIDKYQHAHALTSRQAFCDLPAFQGGLSVDALEAVVRGERKKHHRHAKDDVLKVLGVSDAQWNRAD